MENKVKFQKVSFQERSELHRCPECGRPLKVNSVNKKHKYCYVCYNILNGKPLMYKYNRLTETYKVIDFVDMQRSNIKKYKGVV